MNAPGLIPLVVGGVKEQGNSAQPIIDCDKGCDCFDVGPCYDVECDRVPDPE